MLCTVSHNELCTEFAAPSQTPPTAAPEQWANFSRGEGRAAWRIGVLHKWLQVKSLCAHCIVCTFLIPHPKGNKDHATTTPSAHHQSTPIFMSSCLLALALFQGDIHVLKMCLRCERDHRGWCIWRQWWHQNVWLMPQCREMLVLSRCEPSMMTQRQVSICIPPLSWQEGLMLLFYHSLPVCLGNNESCAWTSIPLFTWHSQDFVLHCFLKTYVWAAYWQSEMRWYGQTLTSLVCGMWRLLGRIAPGLVGWRVKYSSVTWHCPTQTEPPQPLTQCSHFHMPLVCFKNCWCLRFQLHGIKGAYFLTQTSDGIAVSVSPLSLLSSGPGLAPKLWCHKSGL